MISKKNKFPTRVQFLQFRSHAKQLTTPHLRIMYDSHSPSRLSVIVPVKVNKRAVARNGLKHLTYDTMWKIIKDKNLDCILIFKPITLLKGKQSEELILHELSQITDLL